MAGQFDVSLDTMAQSQARMVDNVDAIRTEMTKLRNKVEAVQGQWIGDGNAAFNAAHARYEASNVKLNQALDTISALVDRAGTNYGVGDADASRSMTTQAAAMDVSVPGF